MAATLSYDRLRSILIVTAANLPDHRTRPNREYAMADACWGAFAVFFVQSPSFLAYQQDMQRAKGQNNARSLFEVEQVPTELLAVCLTQAWNGCSIQSIVGY